MSDQEAYSNSHVHGFANDWDEADLNDERIMRWPSPVGERRGISVTIHNWIGYHADTKHVTVRIEEVCNQYWSESRNEWIKVACCRRSEGLSLLANTLSTADAIKLAKTYLKMIDPTGKTHVASWLWSGPEAPSWIEKGRVNDD